jgi:hypothetical protein
MNKGCLEEESEAAEAAMLSEEDSGDAQPNARNAKDRLRQEADFRVLFMGKAWDPSLGCGTWLVTKGHMATAFWAMVRGRM